MSRSQTIRVGVVIARQSLDNPWVDHRWRAVDVIVGAPEISDWKELLRTDREVTYHAATLPLTLHAKDTPGYIHNLETPRPSLYVAIRRTGGGSPHPVTVHEVTASPYEAEAYSWDEDDFVSVVAMPETVIAWVRAFVAAYHQEQPFIKRQRETARAEEVKFGKEPIFLDRHGKRRDRIDG